MSDEDVLYHTDEGVATITINRPKKLNALNSTVVFRMRELFEQAENDDEIRAVVLTGAGEKAFAAGADISEFQGRNSETVRELAENGQELCTYIESMSKPVIAAVNGFALGGGCEIAMACDIRYASENAKFGQPEINLGIIPGFGGTVRLPRLIGLGLSKEMIFTGDHIDAGHACSHGLVNMLFDSVTQVKEEAKAMAQKLAKKPGVAIDLAKRSLNRAWTDPLDKNLEFEKDAFCKTFDTKDQEEGVDAFLSKRKPEFQHE